MTNTAEIQRPKRTERFLGSGDTTEQRRLGSMGIELSLARLRNNPSSYLESNFPGIRFVSLHDLLTVPGMPGKELCNRDVLQQGIDEISQRMQKYGDFHLPDLSRVFVGVNADYQPFYGGFHQSSQKGVAAGYRYLQDLIAVTAVGETSDKVSPEIRSLDIIRSLGHDTFHYNSYREYEVLPEGVTDEMSLGFYRSRYGINSRRHTGESYSKAEDENSLEAHNLGTIMEGAADRFGQEVARDIAARNTIQPTTDEETLIFKEATGQFSVEDLQPTSFDSRNLPPAFQEYADNMRKFFQLVTLPYRNVLSHFDSKDEYFHNAVLQGTLTGDMRELVINMGKDAQGQWRFVEHFKNPNWTSDL